MRGPPAIPTIRVPGPLGECLMDLVTQCSQLHAEKERLLEANHKLETQQVIQPTTVSTPVPPEGMPPKITNDSGPNTPKARGEPPLNGCKTPRLPAVADSEACEEKMSTVLGEVRGEVGHAVQGLVESTTVMAYPDLEDVCAQDLKSAGQELVGALACPSLSAKSPCLQDLGSPSASTSLGKSSLHRQDVSQLKATCGWTPKQEARQKSPFRHISALSFVEAEANDVDNFLQRICVRIVGHFAFQVLICSMIFLNTITMGVSADVNMRAALAKQQRPEWGKVLETFFVIAFGVEILLRVLAEGTLFFVGRNVRWNMFDLIVVLTGFMEFIISAFHSLSFIRILRIFRMLRVMRVIRLFRVFKELRLMVVSIASSLLTLGWAFILLALLMFCFAILFLQGAENYITDREDPNPRVMRSLGKDFPNLLKTMYSLLSAISGGNDWDVFASTLGEISAFYMIVFAFYVAFVVFGVLNVLTGIFVESAGEIARFDHELVLQAHIDHNDSVMNRLERLFQELDLDTDGVLSTFEMEAALRDPRVQANFSELQLDVDEARGLFMLLDTDGSGHVSLSEFLLNCMRLKGGAKSIDIAAMMFENKKHSRRIRTDFERVFAELARLQGVVKSISSGIDSLGALQDAIGDMFTDI